MGTGLLQFPIAPQNRCCSHEFSSRRNSSINNVSTSISWCCCFSTKNGVGGRRTGGSEWDRNSRERTKYLDEAFSYDYEDDDDGQDYGFRNTRKRRAWWSDDSSSWDDEDDDDGEEKIDGFGVLDDAIGFSSIYKFLIGFGWMVPAVIVSMLIGNGTSGFVMALVLPLAQSALSLIFDAVMGRSSDRARSYSRKRSAFAGRARGGNKKTRKERKQNTQSDRTSDDGYQSWESANNFSAKKRERRTQSFGGWDELDR